MSFRKVGGVQYSATQNVVKNRYNTSDNLYVTQNVGEANSFINFLSDISGNIRVYGDFDLSGNLNVAGDIDCSGNLHVADDIDCSGNVNISQNLNVSGDIDCSGNLYVAGDIDCSGNVNISQNLNVDGDIDCIGNITAEYMFLSSSVYTTAANGLVPKAYVDNIASGIKPLPNCVLVQNTSIISPFPPSGYSYTIDGLPLSPAYDGSAVLINAQGGVNIANSNNGVYIVNIGAWTRPSYLDTGDDALATSILITSGLTYKNYTFQCTGNSPGTVGTSALIWSVSNTGTPSLSQVLQVGNTAGSTSINMNNNAITGASSVTATTFIGDLNGNATTASSCSGNSATATTATNIAGGSGGSIPYQSSVSNTSLLANGSAGDVLISGGGTAGPSWSSNFVTTNTTQTISAIKTFSSLPESSVAPTTSNQLTNKTYVDSKVSLTGAETIAGVKTFSSVPICTTAPTTATQLTNKTYVDGAITAGSVTNTTNVNVSAATSGDWFPTFVTAQSGNQAITTDVLFKYNAGTDTLSLGNLTASSAVNLGTTLTLTGATPTITSSNSTAAINISTAATTGGSILISPRNTASLTISPNLVTVTGKLLTTLDASINSITVGRGGGNVSTNTAVGFEALKANTSIQNTAFGYEALKANVGGYNNTAFGYQALYTSSSGIENTAIGRQTLSGNISGFQNTAIGTAGGSANVSGNFNTYIGYDANCNSTNLSNSTAIGANSRVTASNQIVIGTASETMYIQGGLNLRVYPTTIGSGTFTLIDPGMGRTTLYQYYLVNASSGDITITIPVPSSAYNGSIITFRRTVNVGSENDLVNITTNPTSYMVAYNGQSVIPTIQMGSDGGTIVWSATLFCNGSLWYVSDWLR